MRVLGIIPARGGSKGIRRKNLVELEGKPLIAYTIAAALAAKKLTDVIVSTNDEEIANVARSLGADVPFIRPTELAQDNSPTIPVLQHGMQFLEQNRQPYDAVLTLQPTNPLRISSDIDGAVELLQSSRSHSVISFTAVGEKHPARMKSIDSFGRVHDPDFAESFEGQRRQELAPLFLRDGSIYLTRREVLVGGSLKGDDCRAWLIPIERACNIDEPHDLRLVSFLLRLGPESFPGSPASSSDAIS